MKLNSRELKDFFVGTLLGDSSIHNHTFCCKQINEDLIRFKAKVITEHLPDANVNVSYNEAYTDKNGVNHQATWEIYMKRHPYIDKLEKEFYPEGIKIIPQKYIRQLSPIGLAMWYADDGTTVLVGKSSYNNGARSRRVQFCTDCFTHDEIELFRQIFEEQYGRASLIKRGERYRLQIASTHAQPFILDILPFFYNYFPSLLYKMDLGYRDDTLLKVQWVSPEYHKAYLQISAHPTFIDRMKGRRYSLDDNKMARET